MNTPTDAELIAAIDRGVADGSIIMVTYDWLAARAAELDAEEAADAGATEVVVAETIALGPITLEFDTDLDYRAEQWWGVNPRNGDAVFVSRDHPEHLVLPEQKGKPWSATLWIGWEDGERMGNHPADDVHYATRDEAMAAIRRRCAGWYRYLGDHAQAAEFVAN